MDPSKPSQSMVNPGHLQWFEELPCTLTICDRNYTILYMNGKAAEVNMEAGGKALIGKNLMDCHPLRAQKKLKRVMVSDRPNVYTTERKGVKKLVYQCHWKNRKGIGGLVELSFELPSDIPNLVMT